MENQWLISDENTALHQQLLDQWFSILFQGTLHILYAPLIWHDQLSLLISQNSLLHCE